MNRLLILALALNVSSLAAAESPPLEARQVVIRAPELDVIAWVTDPEVTDAKLSDRLWQAVRQGRAHVVSDVGGAVDEAKAASLSVGHHVWLPTELNQDTDRLFMTPVNYLEYFIGASLEVKPEVVEGRVRADWLTHFSPRGTLTVQWPSSWLNIYENQKTTDKAIHGWLDWHDLFEESIVGSVSFQPGVPKWLAILPPADQVWPGGEGGMERLVDVFVGQMGRPRKEASPPPPPLAGRSLLLGIALPSVASLEILMGRQPADDPALLTTLLAKLRAGAARMVFTAGHLTTFPPAPPSSVPATTAIPPKCPASRPPGRCAALARAGRSTGTG